MQPFGHATYVIRFSIAQLPQAVIFSCNVLRIHLRWLSRKLVFAYEKQMNGIEIQLGRPFKRTQSLKPKILRVLNKIVSYLVQVSCTSFAPLRPTYFFVRVDVNELIVG